LSFLPPSSQRLLSSLNPLFFVAAVYGLILVKTALFPFAPSVVERWDVILPFVVFYGQRRSLPEGIVLSLFSSHIYSLCSAAPLGVFTTTYLAVFSIARMISYVAYAGTSFSILLLMIGLSLISRLVLPVVAGFFHPAWPVFSFGNLSLWSILLNGVGGWAIYLCLEIMDQVTNKAPRNSIELSGDSL
jgi:hypothetical protein